MADTVAKKVAKRKTKEAITRRRNVKKVKFKYVFEDNYNPEYANGAHGGLTSQGEICINFFLERNAIPYSEINALDNGHIGEVLGREPVAADDEVVVVRYITTGVVMTPQTARGVRDFIDKNLALLEVAESNTPKQ